MNVIDNSDDLRRAIQLEQQGDEAVSLGHSAAQHYLDAQRFLLPAGVVWADREVYTSRMEAFGRIQAKLYTLDGTGRPRNSSSPLQGALRTDAEPPSDSPVETGSIEPGAELSVWQFYPGLEVRVVQSFRDYDGQEVRAGEILRLLGSAYFFYDGGHTLNFAGKTIRLADVVEEHQAIIANVRNAWFQPLRSEPETR